MTDTQQASAGQPDGAPRGGVPFGRMLTAMITPITADGALDADGAARLATYLVDDMRNDGLIISGTTGESPTTTDHEKGRLLHAVIEAVGDRATIVAGAGTNDTAHTKELAKQAERAGADGLLLVTPYYNKPPQDGLVAHFTAAADATGLPCLLYDIPGRTGTPIATQTLIRLAQHPRIVAVKDAKGDFGAASQVMLATDLVFYSGDDMIYAYRAGRVEEARQIHLDLLPVVIGIMTRTQGAIMTKAALRLLGLPGGVTRLPLVDATQAQIEQLRTDLVAGGVKLPGGAA